MRCWGAWERSLELGVQRGRRRSLRDLDLQHEAAGLDSRAEVREARLLPADLPARHLRTLTAETLCQLGSASGPP